MNAPSNAAVFKSNRSQAIRIPREFAFPEGVKKVLIRRVGRSLVLTPPDTFWDDFFDKPGIDIDEPTELAHDTRESF